MDYNQSIKKEVQFNNLELVEKKVQENNGLILLSAHFGNWEYIAISAGLQLNKNYL